MKNLTYFPAKGKASILRLPLLILFTLFVSAMPGGMPASASITPAFETTVAECTHCGVPDADIVKYLNDRGYIVYDHRPEAGTCNVIVKTQHEYETRVVIENSCIITIEDITY